MRTDDYPADYRLLGLQPGCSVETLERTWRRAVSALHPDRRQALGLDPAQAEQRLHQLTAAYRRLRSFEREHGRLPGGALSATPAPPLVETGETELASAAAATATVVAAVQVSETGQEEAALLAAPPARSRRMAVAAIALLMGAALWFWPGNDSAETDESPGSVGPDCDAGLGQPSTRQAARAELKLGSTLAEVEALLGPPLLRSEDTWEYGPSHVRFERGRVSGWYSSPLRPLPVDRPVR